MPAHLIVAVGGLIGIGMVTTALIYWLGARRVTDPKSKMDAWRWTAAFSLFLCAFLGALPFLTGQAAWLLLFPLLGVGLCLDSIGRIAALASAAVPVRNRSRS